ncbi:hypothetical protein [Micromonospora sp. WMMD812]|uniref:hypothetical protein n=1 Tax=Micromonospora sp. WMMD812 TaxID=3015152 RepID=UPI00248D07B6|nr:hypothetical protein [Micromonospora sp. WMMD812]WBB65906.1 hypothetical protein O7603_22340 [Micromonospora sp. WMMD812]
MTEPLAAPRSRGGAVDRDDRRALHQQAHTRAAEQCQRRRECHAGARPDCEEDEQAASQERAAEDRVGTVAAGAADELAAADQHDDHAEHRRQDQHAAGGGGCALDQLHVLRQEGGEHHHSGTGQQPQDLGDGEVAVAVQAQRHDRLGGATFDRDERRQGHEAHDGERGDRRRHPGVPAAGPAGQQAQRDQSGGEQQYAREVDAGLHPSGRGRHRGGDEHPGGDTDRDVHGEGPPPAEVVGEQAPEHGAGDEGDGHHHSEQAHDPTALAGRHQFGDEREGADHEAAGAETLHGAETDELGHVLGRSGQPGPEQEQDDRRQVCPLAPVEVAELAPDRRRGGHGDEVGRHDPREVLQAAEIVHDHRQRGPEHHPVERRRDHAEDHPDHTHVQRSTHGPLQSRTPYSK